MKIESSACGRGNRVAVEGDHLHFVAGQGDAAIFNGAGVEEVNEQALAFADPDRLAGAEPLVVDGVGHGADFEAVGIGVHGCRSFEQGAVVGVVVLVVHGAGEEGLPVAQGEKELLVVMAAILDLTVGAVDVEKAELAGVGALVEVVHGHGVGVVPAASGGGGRELDALAAMGRDDRRTLLLGAVDAGRDEQPVPVDELRRIGVVDDFYSDGLAFAHAQQGARGGVVVADGGDDVGPVELDGDRSDAEGVVGFGFRRGGG